MLTLYYAPVTGMVIIGLCFDGFTATVGAISIRNDYWAATHAGPHVGDQLPELHMSPVRRASPYLIGIFWDTFSIKSTALLICQSESPFKINYVLCCG